MGADLGLGQLVVEPQHQDVLLSERGVWACPACRRSTPVMVGIA